MLRERDFLLQNPTPSSVDSQQIKGLDPVAKAWQAWDSRKTNLTMTKQMSETEQDADMRELAQQEVLALQEQVTDLWQELRQKVLTNSPGNFGSEGAIIELKQGVGGQESCLFLSEMLRMYTKYCENRAQQADMAHDVHALGANWRVELLSVTPVDVSSSSGGSDALREAILQVKGNGAFEALRFEGGVHRVQRIPTTQNLGKLQTSTIAILVLPMLANDPKASDDIVDPKDVKIETMRSRGAGGQHVNRTESAVRLTHLPTKITVSMQDSRSQHANRAKAWDVLRARLMDRKLREDAAQNRAMRRSQVSSADRSERVRTYNFPQDRVTDHRVNISLSGISSIMDGDDDGGAGLTYLIQQLVTAEEEQRILGMLDAYEEKYPQ
ncbi:Peptide chain release factor 1, mitochondrial [Malassezia yamatoensis]|uniref:Peptide chain release factor 1, mitochondrial n=1 Tax=Malassezia yamatoensis TaxID=253288 RepID=A0AAJ5YR15_9BASI|nr:Peptide chain release factor 1, mitochondrial [Malassezia yamatoensis]